MKSSFPRWKQCTADSKYCHKPHSTWSSNTSIWLWRKLLVGQWCYFCICIPEDTRTARACHAYCNLCL